MNILKIAADDPSLGIVGSTGLEVEQAFNENSLGLYNETLRIIDPVLKLNGSDSFVSFPNAMPINGSDLGSYEMVFKMPTDTAPNQVLFSYGNKIMVTINTGSLFIYYSNIGATIGSFNVSSYAGQKIKLTIKKLATAVEAYIDDVWKYSNPITSPVALADTTLFIGSYTGSGLFSAIDLYYFRVYDAMGNVVVNVNADSGATLNNVKKVIAGDIYLKADNESVVSTNTTTSILTVNCLNAVKSGDANETFQMLVKLPTNVTANQSLFSCGVNSLYMSLYNGKLTVTKENVGAMYAHLITAFAGKEVLITIVRNLASYDLYVGVQKIALNGTANYMSLTASDKILVGSYTGNALHTALDVKMFRKWNKSLTQSDVTYLASDPLNNSIYESDLVFDLKNKGIAVNGWADYRGVAITTFINCSVSYPNAPISTATQGIATTFLSSVPNVIKASTGKEFNLWLDNIILDYEHSGYRVEAVIAGSEVRPMNRAIRMNFATTGAKSVTLNVYDKGNVITESKIITVNVVSVTAGTGTLQFLFVGDSTIDDATMISPGVPYYEHEGPEIVKEFTDLCTANTGFTPLMLGHKKNYPPYYHAGMTGYDTTWFLDSHSPFWDGTKNNFKSYVQTNIIGQAGAVDRVDYMIYQIGINNLKNGTAASVVITGIKTFIDQFIVDYPTAKIIIGYPASGCDATGWSVHFFGNTSFVTFRKNMIDLWKLIESEFNGNALYPNVYACNAGQWIDRVYGMPYKLLPISARSAETQLTHWDSVHPEKSGYDQAADAYFAKVKSLA